MDGGGGYGFWYFGTSDERALCLQNIKGQTSIGHYDVRLPETHVGHVIFQFGFH